MVNLGRNYCAPCRVIKIHVYEKYLLTLSLILYHRLQNSHLQNQVMHIYHCLLYFCSCCSLFLVFLFYVALTWHTWHLICQILISGLNKKKRSIIWLDLCGMSKIVILSSNWFSKSMRFAIKLVMCLFYNVWKYSCNCIFLCRILVPFSRKMWPSATDSDYRFHWK